MPIDAANFYDLVRDAQRALSISPLRDLLSDKGSVASPTGFEPVLPT
jgi:hypothetical protein